MTTTPPRLPESSGGSADEALESVPKRNWTLRWAAALIVVVLLGELAAFSYTLVATALPGIGAHFHATNIGWTVTIANLVTAVAVALIGKLADLRGKRLILVIVTALSALGAIISAMAPTYEVFLVGRGLQGLLYVVPALGYSLIRDVFPKALIAFAVTVTFTGAGVLFVVAPFIAGWMIDTFGALSVFWFLAIYQIGCIAGVLLLLPESPLRVKSRLDWLGALLLGGGGAILVYALGQAAGWGWTSARFVGLTALGVGCFLVWLWWDRRFPEPIIEIGILRARSGWTTLVLNGAVYGTTAIVVSLVPMMIQMPREIGGDAGFGTDASGVAVYMAPMGAAMVLGGLLCGSRAARWGIRYPMVFGCSALIIGAGGLALWHAEAWQVVTLLLVFGLGMGFTYGGLPNLVLQSAPPEKQGITSSIMLSAQNLTSALAAQIAFGLLAMHVIASGEGVFFSGEGYRIAFIVAAVFATAGLLILKILPHGRASDVASVKTAADVVGH
ncbi:MFS transporter [Nocardia rhamnosiphila]|uniref:MFS transporter n=1 Tax=Nocardia rhamnosiphila TaxID=426716 RepID=UPI0033D678E9